MKPRAVAAVETGRPTRAEILDSVCDPRTLCNVSALIALLVGLYNPASGARLASKIECNGFGALIAPLSPAQREAVAQLLIHYKGW